MYMLAELALRPKGFQCAADKAQQIAECAHSSS